MARVIMIPLFMVVLYLDFPLNRYVALAIFIVASCSDMLDGYIARHYNQVTDFGKFMDPLADKVLVMAAMTMLVSWGQMPAWVLLVVIVREFAVTALRLVAVEGGRVIAAGWSGKVKTATTMVCICIMLLPFIPAWLNALCCAAILLTTVYSGAEYFLKNKDVIDWTDM
jgi:CDP-diacylglycerol--glycerol-3-phosphate 3-phosphatidyltransferase